MAKSSYALDFRISRISPMKGPRIKRMLSMLSMIVTVSTKVFSLVQYKALSFLLDPLGELSHQENGHVARGLQ